MVGLAGLVANGFAMSAGKYSRTKPTRQNYEHALAVEDEKTRLVVDSGNSAIKAALSMFNDGDALRSRAAHFLSGRGSAPLRDCGTANLDCHRQIAASGLTPTSDICHHQNKGCQSFKRSVDPVQFC